MRLTAIKLAGFKSFVDPTTLRLTGNMTGIVGPNGCGKSNVIDAVRWVTGESSAKQLRGEALEDVIFNGSKARKPVGRASIELRFDNSDGKLGGRYAGFAEIAIRREISRDGGSQYHINGSRCRRRDVVDLFLGTGLGGRNNYAVIEQGSVTRLIEAKPEDMRHVLEEAAGISKYKERRRETENRIRHTRENLDRLNDLIGEVGQRLTLLQRQAANAEKYKRYKAEERRLRAELLALRWRALDADAARQEAQLDERRHELEAAQVQARESTARREAGNADQQAAAHECQRLQGVFYAADAEVARVEQAIVHARELARVQRAELEDWQGQADGLDERIRSEQAAIDGLRRAVTEQTRALEVAGAEQARAGEQLQTAERGVGDGEAEWEALAGDDGNPLQRAEAERARLEHLGQDQAILGERLDKLLGERARIELEAPQTALADAEQAVRHLAGELEDAQADHRAVEADVGRLRDERSALDARLYATRQALTEARGRLSSLDALQQAALREDDDTLRAWLRRQDWDDARGAAHSVRVSHGWEAAAEAALGGFLRALCLPDLSKRAAAVSTWPEQQLTLVDADVGNLADASPGGVRGARSLATVVHGPVALRQMARGIFLVEDETDARALLPQLQQGQMLVTRAGVCFGPGWLRTARRGDDEEGLLKRKQRIAGLRAEVERQTAVQAALDTELQGLRERLQAAEVQRAAHGERQDELRRRHGERLAERQGLNVRLEQLQRRRRDLDSEIDDIRAQRQACEQAAEQVRARLDDIADAAREFVQRRQALQERLRELREARDGAARARDRVVERQQALRVDLAGRRGGLEAAEQRHRDLLERRVRLDERVGALTAALAAVETADTDSEQAKTQAQARRDEARDALENARARLVDIEARAQDLTQREQAAQAAVENAREAVQQLRVAFETAAVRRQTLEEQLTETGHRPRPLCAQLAENASPADWEARIEGVQRRIQRLGAINLAAIEEFDNEREREHYLQSQQADLLCALTTLESAIAKIDRETRSRFRDTFESVNHRFGALFPVLFGGGQARLELTEDDLLATGVRVMARPPGKRNTSIQLLSGGEKALSAVALLFALFELNPAPFCMLDEIDAPLDDTNVARFCDLVAKMAETVQFIVITHNKLTMEMTQQLHGVTMQEPGVSRLVSVDVEQALEMAG